jgi:Carboxypeptidase regulatory-like domain
MPQVSSPYTLRIQVAGFQPRDLDVEVEDARETSLGRLPLELSPRLPCRGEFDRPRFHETKLRSGSNSLASGITLEGGAALIHETITLLEAGTQSLIGATKTDQNGRFQFADVPPGNYELLVSSDGPMLRVKVRKGHELEVRLTWKVWPEGQLCL